MEPQERSGRRGLLLFFAVGLAAIIALDIAFFWIAAQLPDDAIPKEAAAAGEAPDAR